MALIDNLTNYWKLDENTGTTTTDVVTSTASNITGAAWSSLGKINNCLSFDGVSDYVALPSGIGSAAGSASRITVNAWIKSTSTGKTSYIFVCSGQYVFLRFDTNNHLVFAVTGSGGDIADAGTGFNDNNWHMVTGTYDGTSQRIYVDAVLKATDTASMGYAATPNSISFNSATQAFTGLIDEVGLWSRCLDQSEITQLYNSGSGLAYPFATTVANNAIMLGHDF
jgi:hypothetical protein